MVSEQVNAVKRIMIDTNIYDALSGDTVTRNRLIELVKVNIIKILSTHVQHDEISRIPNEDKQNFLSQIPSEEVSTSVFVWGTSRWGKGKWGSGSDNGVNYHAIQKDNPKHIEDAIIAVTAADESDVFVTNDSKLRRKILAQSPMLEVWTYEQLKSYIESLS